MSENSKRSKINTRPSRKRKKIITIEKKTTTKKMAHGMKAGLGNTVSIAVSIRQTAYSDIGYSQQENCHFLWE